MLLNLRQRFVLFICLAVFGMVLAGFIGGFIVTKWPVSTAAVRIASVFQSLFQLIIPAIATALLVTRRPATFLAVDRKADPMTFLLSVAGLIVATPVMNCIIKANAEFALLESMSALEAVLRNLEEQAAATISLLQGEHTPMNLAVNILIVGVMAGFGEELFFRGAFMRLMTTGGVNRHVAVWTVAIVFSALHLQFFGFVPRMLLGAYFGYLLAWSRCLWVPVCVHAANNIIYVVAQYVSGAETEASPLDSFGTDGGWTLPLLSAVSTIVILVILYRRRVTTA